MTRKLAYRSAVAVALGAALFLVAGFEILGLTGMFAILFATSAWLFRSVAAGQVRAGAPQS